MSQPVLSVEDLVVEYPVPAGVLRAVDSVSFNVERGATIAIVGESGCGKSTIAKSIVRLLTPTSGRILIDGTDIAQLSEKALRPFRSRVQMIFQDPYGSLDPHLTAVDIVGEPLRLQGLRDKRERAHRAGELMDRVGLPTTALHRRPAEFSGGQRQRIGIARAVVRNSPILILDEPTAALDTESEKVVMEALERLMEGRTVITIAHRLSTIRDADKIVVLKGGVVAEQGKHDELVKLGGIYADLYRVQVAPPPAATQAH